METKKEAQKRRKQEYDHKRRGHSRRYYYCEKCKATITVWEALPKCPVCSKVRCLKEL